MFQIKICGVTSVEDAHQALAAGADSIGLNFAPPSPRCLSIAEAEPIAAAIGSRAIKVGVFVNAPADEIHATYERLALDLVQIHGDEPAEYLQTLGDLPVVRAFRCGAEGLAPIAAYLETCQALGSPPRLVLIDAFDPTGYGGTGALAPWNEVARFRDLQLPFPVILAGGLKPENVAAAIAQARPAGVDVASGVEFSPGKKDHRKMAAFVAAARAAFAARGTANR